MKKSSYLPASQNPSMKEPSNLPRARREGLVVEELTDELLVYDLERNRAHCLNVTAAAVWKQCDGHSTAADIARRLLVEPKWRKSSDAPELMHVKDSEAARDRALKPQQLTEQVVWLALEQLSRDHLLEERMSWPAALPRVSRREALKRIGIGAAIAVPIVVSITAPTPVQAGTCKPHNASCTTGIECCSTICSGGHCV
jgi:hypothetical protein